MINNSTGNFHRYFKYKSQKTNIVVVITVCGRSVIAIININLELDLVQYCNLNGFCTLPHGIFPVTRQ